MSENNEKKTLTDEEIVTEKTIGRRSTLGIIGASVVGVAVAAAVGLRGSPAQAQQGPSDSDSGPGEDAPGRGRTGASDRDSGPNEDHPNHGVCALRGTSDQDSGPGEDPPAHGRGPCHQ